MNVTEERAREVRRRYHLTRPGDIERVLEARKITVLQFPLHGRLKEMAVEDMIGLAYSVEPHSSQARELLAHALGHCLLHCGNQPFFLFDHMTVVALQYERQAWDFAFELLMPEDKVEKMLKSCTTLFELREQFQVSEDFFRRRMYAFRDEREGRGCMLETPVGSLE
jgi:spore cortex formation protein SpoVR/YcgB (stage V sporulation)